MKHLTVFLNLSIFCVLQLVIFSCTDSKSPDDSLCYSFDKRQCNGDPWINENTTDEIASLKEYLIEQGIKVNSIEIDRSFHNIVCEACFVCPVGPRYYVSILAEDQLLLQQLDLLSLGEADKCD